MIFSRKYSMENKAKKVYSDGTIEERVYDYLKEKNGDNRRIIDMMADGAVFHNFTPARESLLNWYPFRRGSRVLEIGAGMGALTPFLASVCEFVIALEPSQSRARIISERCKTNSNVQVITQPLDTYNGGEQSFDYVTLIGVLEYAGIYSESDNPWLEMLQKARSFLKPDGKLLLAIENKFGLKYWCGAAEDHTGIPFDSLNNYEDNGGATDRYSGNKGVRTFSKEELEVLLKEAGFLKNKFYYALPDYKFPMLILTDESKSADVLIGDVKFGYPEESILVANEMRLYPEIVRNGALSFFANSYFVEALNSDEQFCEINTVTIKRDYKAPYRIITALDKNRATRTAANKESHKHIERLVSNTRFLLDKKIPCVAQEVCGEGKTWACMIDGLRADSVFMHAVRSGDTAMALKMLDTLKQYLLKSSDSFEQNGRTILKIGYIDMTFRNSFWKDGDLLFFDQEWTAEDIPLQYILYRAIRYAMIHLSELDSNRYYEYCGITREDQAVFASMEHSFLQSLMDEQNCQWFDRTMYRPELELKNVIDKKTANKEAHIKQLIESERNLQSDIKCKDGHIEQLLQSERDLLAENAKKSEQIKKLQFDLGYQTSVADNLRRSEAELRKELGDAYREINRLQYELGNRT